MSPNQAGATILERKVQFDFLLLGACPTLPKMTDLLG